MKKNTPFLLTAWFASCLACFMSAQETRLLQTPRAGTPVEGGSHAAHGSRLTAAIKASEVLGATVRNHQDIKLGSVHELALDLESGRILQVIVATGGFIGIGESLKAVPPGALHYEASSRVFQLDVDKEKLEGLPSFEMAKWAEGCDRVHLTAVYRSFGLEPALVFIGSAQRNVEGAAVQDERWTIEESRLGQAQRASKIIGCSVVTLQDERLGRVDNILADLGSGRIVAITVSSGGFLKIGDELSAVPPSAFRFNEARDTLRLDTTAEKLSQAPHFKANQWPDFAHGAYVNEVYKAYGVAPYFTTNGASVSANGGDSSDERSRPVPKSVVQGNNQADVNTTAEIRKNITADGGMSLNARNVKIVTNNGRVTLRGPVDSSEEKRLIENIAVSATRIGYVDNQLEIK